MSRSAVLLFSLLLTLAVRARAQTFVSIFDTLLPPGHDTVIGFGAVGSNVDLFTVATFYESPAYNGAMNFTQSAIHFPSLGMTLNPGSFVTLNPATPNLVYLSGSSGFSVVAYTVRFTPLAASAVTLQGFTLFPSGLAWSPTLNTLVAADSTHLYAINLGNGARTLIDTSAAGPLSSAGEIVQGPDGRVYVLDVGNNRVVGVDPTSAGSLALNTFPLAGTTAASALAIDSAGVLFTADGNGGGDAYDIHTGAHLGVLSSVSQGLDGDGHATLLANGGLLYLWDANTGLHVYDTSAVDGLVAIPEPAGAWLAATAALTFAWYRRRRAGAATSRT